MKIITSVLFFLFININASAQIKVSSYIEIGALNANFAFRNSGYINYMIYDNVGYSELALFIRYKNITIKQTLNNIASIGEEGVSINCKYINYTTNVYYKINMFKIGFEYADLSLPLNRFNRNNIVRRKSFYRSYIRYTFNANE